MIRTAFPSSFIKGAVASLLTLGVGMAMAGDIKVTLKGDQEVPPVATTTATGTGTFHVADDKSITGMIKTTGIEGTAAHVHEAAPGKNGPPIITLTKAADGSWAVPAGSALTDAQLASLKAGNLYVNVHSAAHKGGEIRAQLK